LFVHRGHPLVEETRNLSAAQKERESFETEGERIHSEPPAGAPVGPSEPAGAPLGPSELLDEQASHPSLDIPSLPSLLPDCPDIHPALPSFIAAKRTHR